MAGLLFYLFVGPNSLIRSNFWSKHILILNILMQDITIKALTISGLKYRIFMLSSS